MASSGAPSTGTSQPSRGVVEPIAEAPIPIASSQPPLNIMNLKHFEAPEMARILEKVFRPASFSVTPVPHNNSLIIRADEKTLKEVKMLLHDLDVPGENASGSAGSPDFGPPAATPGPPARR